MINPYQLGASLYVPAIHEQLPAIARGDKLGFVRSLIYCTEDALHPNDLPQAFAQLQLLLDTLPAQDRRLHFIRLRNPQVMQEILQLRGIEKISGFVLPKISPHNLHEYAPLLSYDFALMPTLETGDTFLESAMLDLRRQLLHPEWFARILCLRIGGNDLLSLLHMRRSRNATIYQGALGALIARLVGIFKPYGFYLTAPVFEFLEEQVLLAQEVQEDLRYGLIGKTAIHPEQIPLIERHYRVSAGDKYLAEQILSSQRAVFNADATMQEVSTHSNWAQAVLKAWAVYGEK